MTIHIENLTGTDTFAFDWIIPGDDEGVLYFQELHYDGGYGVTVAVLRADDQATKTAIESAINSVYPYRDVTLDVLPEQVAEFVTHSGGIE